MKLLLVAVLATAVVGAGTAAFVATRPGQRSEAPLSNLGMDSVGFSLRPYVGQSVSVSGPFVVENTGDRPLVLEHIVLVRLQSGATLRGAYVLPIPDPPYIGAIYGYRVPENGRPLHGATVPPHTEVAIVLGIKATKPGRHAWFAVDIVYRYGGSTLRLRSPLSGRICVSKAPYVGAGNPGCPTPLDTRGAP